MAYTKPLFEIRQGTRIAKSAKERLYLATRCYMTDEEREVNDNLYGYDEEYGN